VPDLRGGVRGDQIVTIQVVTPKQLTDDQRALFEELAASLGSDIQQQPNSKGFFGRMKDAFGAKV
jgi:molecular chaperone DnaJ